MSQKKKKFDKAINKLCGKDSVNLSLNLDNTDFKVLSSDDLDEIRVPVYSYVI